MHHLYSTLKCQVLEHQNIVKYTTSLYSYVTYIHVNVQLIYSSFSPLVILKKFIATIIMHTCPSCFVILVQV